MRKVCRTRPLQKKERERKKKGLLAHLHLINYLTGRIKIDLDGQENKSASGLLAPGVEVRTWVWITIREGSDIRCQPSLLSGSFCRAADGLSYDPTGCDLNNPVGQGYVAPPKSGPNYGGSAARPAGRPIKWQCLATLLSVGGESRVSRRLVKIVLGANEASICFPLITRGV